MVTRAANASCVMSSHAHRPLAAAAVGAAIDVASDTALEREVADAMLPFACQRVDADRMLLEETRRISWIKGDVATIYGTDECGQVLLANRVARSIGTVTSDLLCAVSQRVERIYLR